MALPWHRSQLEDLVRRKDRLPHALLIRGPQGIGKAAFADSLAQALLCERPAPGGGCGVCQACAWLAQGTHPDFRALEPKEPEKDEAPRAGGDKKPSLQISVEQVRALADFINLTSHRGGARVVPI